MAGDRDRGGRELLRYECSIVIEAPARDVFAVVGDLGRTTEWAGSGHIRSVTKMTDGPIGVGTRYRSSEKITMSYGGDTVVTEYRPDAAIAWDSKPVGERVPYHHWAFRLEPDPAGTRLVHSVRAMHATGLMRWIQRVGFLFTRPERTIAPGMDRTLQNVKRLVESRDEAT